MMRLLAGMDAGRLHFGLSGARRWVGAAVALTAIAVFFLTMPSHASMAWHSAALIGSALLLLGGLLMALWEEDLEIDLPLQTFRYRRGIAPFLLVESGPVSTFLRLSLATQERALVEGGIERRYVLSLRHPQRPIPLLEIEDPEEARRLADRLSSRLSLPLEETTALPGSTRRTYLPRLITVVAWSGILAVILTMLWPVLSGSKRITFSHLRRPPTRSTQVPSGFFGFPPGPYQQGMIAYERREFDRAERIFRNLLPQDPANSYNMLAYVYAGRGDLNKALEYARKASQTAPKAGYIVDTVAEMHQRRREWREAARLYEKALRMMPESEAVETHAKYGRTLAALGRYDQAIDHLQIAVRSDDARWGMYAYNMLAHIRMMQSQKKPR
jgi:Tfp pilus assembly protein PilF